MLKRKVGRRSIRQNLDTSTESLNSVKDLVSAVDSSPVAAPMAAEETVDLELSDRLFLGDGDGAEQQPAADNESAASSCSSDCEEDAAAAEIRGQQEAFLDKAADVCDNACSCCHRY